MYIITINNNDDHYDNYNNTKVIGVITWCKLLLGRHEVTTLHTSAAIISIFLLSAIHFEANIKHNYRPNDKFI